jgi:secreted trypsin-like serine protease
MTRRDFTVFHFLLFLGLHLTSGATVRNRFDHGAPAVPNWYPYFALVKYFYTKGSSGSCGGSLIAPDVILTAATCVGERQYGPLSSVEVWVNSTSDDYSEYDHFRKATRWVIHPGYNEFGFGNDIALLFLDTPVVDVPHLLLNRDDSLPDASSRMTILGNGYTRSNYDYGVFPSVETYAPSRLQQPVNMLPSHACWKVFGAENFKKSLLCASDHGLGSDGSGGPLMIASATAKEDVQVGIVSNGARRSMEMGYWADGDMGYRSGDNGLKGYTKVSHFVEWIDAQICQYSASKPSSCQTETPETVN